MGNSPGRTENPAYATWQAQLDQVDNTIDKVKASPMAFDKKWLVNTLAHYQGLRLKLLETKPPKWLEDVTPGAKVAPGPSPTKRKPGKHSP